MFRTWMKLATVILAAMVARAQQTPDSIVASLKTLEPLPKIHYSWALPGALFDVNDQRLFELVRITHAASLRGEWGTSRQVETAVIVCKAVNAAKPAIPATLAINYSPWAPGRFGKGISPETIDPRVRRLHEREVSKFREKLVRFKAWLADANQRHHATIRVSALLLDCEQFKTRGKGTAWRKAMTARYNEIYDAGRAVFPDARIEWWGRGILRAACPGGWREHGLFTLQEQGDYLSCSLYTIPEIGYTRETFRRTYVLAKTHGVEEVTPWVALASGWRRQTEHMHAWHRSWDYDRIYSWQLGRELNNPWFALDPERFAPWDAAKVVVFYPAPFDPRAPAWGKHFVAYVRGAAGAGQMGD